MGRHEWFERDRLADIREGLHLHLQEEDLVREKCRRGEDGVGVLEDWGDHFVGAHDDGGERSVQMSSAGYRTRTAALLVATGAALAVVRPRLEEKVALVFPGNADLMACQSRREV